ncbi:MAG TPA: restriction endonuclease subunit S [Polyangiaceae bacterium]
MTCERTLKDSGVSWLGSLPEDWAAVPLKQRTTLVSRGRSPDYADDDEGVPIVNQACIYWDGIRYENVKWQRRSTLSGERGRLRYGDLLVNSTGTGTLGRATLLDRTGEFLADSHVTVVRTTREASGSFLRYVLQTETYQGYLYSVLAPGATNQIELSREGLRRTPFPMPRVDEQRAIASFLDRKTAAIDALIAKKERLIELLQEKRQALITQAVTSGLDPSVPMKKSGLSGFGNVPSHWTVSRVRYEARLVSKGTTPSTVGRELTTAGVRFLKAENLLDGAVRPDPEFYIDEQTDRLLQRSRLKSHDLLIVIAGATTGKSAVLPPAFLPSNTNQAVCFVRLKETTFAPFLRAFFSTRYIQDLVWLSAVQAAQPNLSMENIRTFPCLVPPTDEVNRIVAYLADVEQRSALLTGAARAQVEKLREYRQVLITAAVTGKIDVSKEAA